MKEKVIVLNERKEPLYIALESHPNIGGLWIGKIGTKEEIQEYIDGLKKEGHLDYLYCILKLEEHADMQDGYEHEFGLERKIVEA